MTLHHSLLAFFCCNAVASTAWAIAPYGPHQGLVNGGFEGFDQGVPVGWIYFQTDGPANLSSTNVSPRGSGKYSVLLTDAGTEYYPGLSQQFAPLDGEVEFSFDFQIVGAPLTSSPSWLLYPVADSGAVPMGIAFLSSAGLHQIEISQRLAPLRVTIAPDTWYHLQVSFDLANGRHSGSLESESQILRTWSDLQLSNGAADNISRLEIADFYVQRSNSLYLDNFVLRSVPEPSSLLLLAPALLLLWNIRAMRRLAAVSAR